VFDALCAGATGYMLKKSSAVEILEAISELHSCQFQVRGGDQGDEGEAGEINYISSMWLYAFGKTRPLSGWLSRLSCINGVLRIDYFIN